MSREKEESAESAAEIVRVLNNVLSSSGMCIELRNGECGVRISKEVLGTYSTYGDRFAGGWQTPEQLLLGDDNFVSMFDSWTFANELPR